MLKCNIFTEQYTLAPIPFAFLNRYDHANKTSLSLPLVFRSSHPDGEKVVFGSRESNSVCCIFITGQYSTRRRWNLHVQLLYIWRKFTINLTFSSVYVMCVYTSTIYGYECKYIAVTKKYNNAVLVFIVFSQVENLCLEIARISRIKLLVFYKLELVQD